MLGFGDKAFEYYRMINPIEHARTKEAAKKYKVEPYVIAADIYGAGNLSGRGGWTWYTGSSSWYYVAGIEYILGLKIKNETMYFEPCVPKDWDEYKMVYKWGKSIYHITVKNNSKQNNGTKKVFLDGVEIDNSIKLNSHIEKAFYVDVIL